MFHIKLVKSYFPQFHPDELLSIRTQSSDDDHEDDYKSRG